jgi:hypothetical protein
VPKDEAKPSAKAILDLVQDRIDIATGCTLEIAVLGNCYGGFIRSTDMVALVNSYRERRRARSPFYG